MVLLKPVSQTLGSQLLLFLPKKGYFCHTYHCPWGESDSSPGLGEAAHISLSSMEKRGFGSTWEKAVTTEPGPATAFQASWNLDCAMGYERFELSETLEIV